MGDGRIGVIPDRLTSQNLVTETHGSLGEITLPTYLINSQYIVEDV